MLTIKEIIDRLQKEDPEKTLKLGWDDYCSSVANYSELGLIEKENARICDMVSVLKHAIGKTLDGYKGGKNLMEENTFVHITDDYSRSGDELTERLLEYIIKDEA
jgi:hypothetical protein